MTEPAVRYWVAWSDGGTPLACAELAPDGNPDLDSPAPACLLFRCALRLRQLGPDRVTSSIAANDFHE